MIAAHLPALRAALAAYDAHADTLDVIGYDIQQLQWTETEDILANACVNAFADLTADVNSRENARLVRPCYWTRDDLLHQLAAQS